MYVCMYVVVAVASVLGRPRDGRVWNRNHGKQKSFPSWKQIKSSDSDLSIGWLSQDEVKQENIMWAWYTIDTIHVSAHVERQDSKCNNIVYIIVSGNPTTWPDVQVCKTGILTPKKKIKSQDLLFYHTCI